MAVALRRGVGTGVTGLLWLFGDHLGSTSVTADYAGALISRTLYKPWGEVRYQSGTLPTKYTFTGQYSHVSDFGLLFYNARWYDPALGRFAQADSIVPGAGNPLAWDRYAGMMNNPVRYTDPSGHLVCSDAHVAEGDCSDEGVGLWRFGVTLEGSWTSEYREAVRTAVRDVGLKLAQVRGGTGWDAFRKVYKTDSEALVFLWGTERADGTTAGLSEECRGIGSGGCTSSSHLINFMPTWSNPLSARNNVVHELGHAFNNLLWTTGFRTGSRIRLGETILSDAQAADPNFPNRPDNGTGTYGFAGPYGTWQQSRNGSPSEEFADSFLGWTYGRWEAGPGGITPQGKARSDFMSFWMPLLIDFAGGG